MIVLARALVRVVTFVLLVVLSAAGIVLALGQIATGTSGPSMGGLADLLRLSALRDSVGGWLSQLEASGPTAAIAALSGLGAILVGLMLLAGILVPRRERLVTLDRTANGTLAARRRPLAHAATALIERVRGVAGARVRARPGRRRGGRLRVRAVRTRPADPRQVRTAVHEQLAELTEPFALTARIDVRRNERERVQ